MSLLKLVWILALSIWHQCALAGYSDPVNPKQIVAEVTPEKVPFYEIAGRIAQVEQEILQEQEILEALAPLEPAKQIDAFGYHSEYLPAVDGVPPEAMWTMDLDAGISNRRVQGIVMVPTIDQRSAELQGYAFPKRFRISSLSAQGEVGEVYVDWTERDFPDPGMRPVFFKFLSQSNLDPTTVSKKGLRLEVFAGEEEGGLEFFSLGKLHLLRTNELHWPRGLDLSSSFESAPYWSADYLSSSRLTLGMPLTSRDGNGGDLRLNLPKSQLDEPLVFRVELDQKGRLGKLNIFPGHSPDGMDVPGYGFPKSMKLYRLVRNEETQQEQRHRFDVQAIPSHPGSNMLRFNGFGREVLALEIECNEFPVYQGQVVFSMGEIELFISGENLSIGRPVRLTGGSLEGDYDLSALVDGRVDGRSILSLREWLEQLASAKPHEAKLVLLGKERAELQARWDTVRYRGILGLVSGVAFGIVAFVVFMLRRRKVDQERLRKQINADLHDDVGSSLGSISLIAEQLQDADVDELVRDDLKDLALISREAWASLREVVWVVDESSIPLAVLIQKLSDRAQRVLNAAQLHVKIAEDLPRESASLAFKRHLLMYFKEVVHNCARHAQASEVWLDFSLKKNFLILSVRDNGVGFETNRASTGIGLESMKNRAKEMDGDIEIQSSLGKGTQVILSVPLEALKNTSDHSYKTSN